MREQFGRPIATFQAVKHHCANMLVATELATAAVWDAARAASSGGDQFSYAAAVAATLALPAADLTAQLNIQVHGGIGFTWEHDAHLYLRRATAMEAIVDAEAAAQEITDLTRRGIRRESSVDLPPEAEAIAETCARSPSASARSTPPAQRDALIESGYVMPHWPEPWGRDAGAVEQLVIEQEFKRHGITRPAYGITGWVILTLIQHGSERPGRALGAARAAPGRHLVPAVQRARRRLRRRRRQDEGHPRRRRLAGQRPEGLDQRRPRVQARLRHRAHQPRRAQARRHHHDGDRHAGRRASRCDR